MKYDTTALVENTGGEPFHIPCRVSSQDSVTLGSGSGLRVTLRRSLTTPDPRPLTGLHGNIVVRGESFVTVAGSTQTRHRGESFISQTVELMQG